MDRSVDRDRSFRSLAIIAVLVAVVGISVAFAALSQSLNVTGVVGSGGNTAPDWNVNFENQQAGVPINYAVEDAAPELTRTTFKFAISLFVPGDQMSYKFDVKNSGTIDVKVGENGVELFGLDKAAENNITFTLTYANGTPIQVGDELNVGEFRTLLLTVAYNEDADQLLSSDLELELSAKLEYVQK